MARIMFSVEGRPVPQPRPRVGRNRHAYYPGKRYKAWRGAVAAAAMQACEPPFPALSGEIKATIHVGVPDRRHGDLSNYIKVVEDACEGIVFANDKQIRAIEATLRVAEVGRTDIAFEEINDA